MTKLFLFLPFPLALYIVINSFELDLIKPEVIALFFSTLLISLLFIASRHQLLGLNRYGIAVLSAVCLSLISIYSVAFLAEGKLDFFLLLLIAYMFQFLYGIYLERTNLLVCNLRLCSVFISLSSFFIFYCSFTAYSLDGWDVLGTSSGKVLARASIGLFESNSLAIAACALVSICILFLEYLQKITVFSSSSIKLTSILYLIFKPRFYLYLSLILLLMSILRTFSRTAFIALLFSGVLSILFEINLSTNFKFSKLIKSIAFSLLFLSAFVLVFSIIFPELQEISLSRYSPESLTFDARIDIWDAKFEYLKSNLFVGSGVFEFYDNFWLSTVTSLGLMVGGLVIFFSLSPFFYLFKQSFFAGKLPWSIRFSSFLLCFSALFYSLSGDFIGQSKTLPILYLTCGLLLNKVNSLSRINL